MFSPLATADTLNYMIAGYAVIFGAMLGYVVSLIIRYHKAKQELSNLEEL